jgi:LuxR family transcriptional regulator
MLEYLRALAASTKLEDVWQLHCSAMAGHGFDRLIYGYSRFAFQGPGSELDDALFLSNHDPAYFDRFIGEKMFLNAPMTRWGRENYGACSWGTLWKTPEQLSEDERRVIAFNRKMGVHAGVSISFADANPRSFGMISMAARPGLSQQDVDVICARDGATIEVLNHMVHLKILSLPHTTMRSRLSDRQREALEWVGEGKSNQDIATIMGVSLPTVEKHLRLAREKLGVDTTAQAILKASFQNQIYVL